MADLERVLWSPALAEQEEEGEEDGWGKEPAGGQIHGWKGKNRFPCPFWTLQHPLGL